MKRLILLVVLLLVGFYVGWPAFSGWQLHAALERKDAATVGRKVDFPSVRAALAPVVEREVGSGMDRYLADLGPLAGMLGPVLKQQYAPRVVEATLNTLITPESIVQIYAEKDDMRSAAERILMAELGKPGGLFSGLLGGGRQSDGSSLVGRIQGQGGLEAATKGLGNLGNLGGLIPGGGGPGGGGAIPGLPGGANMPDLKDVLTKMIEKGRTARGAKPALEAAAPPSKDGFGVGNIKKFGFNGPLAMEVGVATRSTAPKSDVVAEMAFRGFDWKVTRLVPGL